MLYSGDVSSSALNVQWRGNPEKTPHQPRENIFANMKTQRTVRAGDNRRHSNTKNTLVQLKGEPMSHQEASDQRAPNGGGGNYI